MKGAPNFIPRSISGIFLNSELFLVYMIVPLIEKIGSPSFFQSSGPLFFQPVNVHFDELKAKSVVILLLFAVFMSNQECYYRP